MGGCVVRYNSNPLLCVGRRVPTNERKFLSIFVICFQVYGLPYEYHVIEATVSGHTCCQSS